MKNSWLACAVVLAALLACKEDKQAAPAPAPAPAPPPPSAEEPKQEKITDFRGTYTTNWGSARCTQVKRNVNCLYAGKSGGLQCKVIGDDELDCDWDEPGLSGKAKLTRQEDGRLTGTWGNGESYKNGGPWIFKPKDED
jgi:hypothetical protein